MIDVHCDNCGLHVQIADALAGKKGKCPKCGRVLVIGQPGSKKPAQAASRAPASKPVSQRSSTAPAPAAPQPTPAAAQPPASAAEPIPFDSLGDDEPAGP